MIENEYYRINLTRSELTDKMKEDIKLFKLKFELKYRITPYVSVNTKKNYVGELSMLDLLDIVNKEMRKVSNDETADIKNVVRKRPVVIYRQVFCKVASSIGYASTVIGRFLNQNHSTILHSVKMVDTLIETGDKDMTNCVNNIYIQIEKYLAQKII
jgi:chromosomal replication initiation ATPase DnaA